MMRHLAVSLLIVVCACHKRADKAFFGTQVAPPGILAQVHPGMAIAQLRAIAPDLKADPGKGFLLASLTKRWGALKSEKTKSTKSTDEQVTYSWAGHATALQMGDAVLAVVIGP